MDCLLIRAAYCTKLVQLALLALVCKNIFSENVAIKEVINTIFMYIHMYEVKKAKKIYICEPCYRCDGRREVKRRRRE